MEDFPLREQSIGESYPQLRGSVQADAAIIGGGLTGAACAAMLSAHGVNTVLLEARTLGRGASWSCTGKVTSQLAGVYQTIAKAAGLDAAVQYARLMREAVVGVRSLCQRMNIPTQENSVYVFAETTDDLPALHRLYQLETRLGLPVRYAPDAGGCPFPVELALVTEHQLLLAPLPYLHRLISFAAEQGCAVHEHTPAQEIDGHVIRTPSGCVEARSIILATGSPAGCTSLPRLCMLQQRTCQTLTLEGGVPLLHSHLSVHADELTLRPTATGALLAWDLGRTGGRARGKHQRILQRTLNALLPEMRVIDSHTRQDVWSGDGLPVIGSVTPGDSHLLMATGYSGWGIAGSFLAARVLAGCITGKPMPEAALFRPDRPSPKWREGLRIASAYGGSLIRPGAPACPHMGGKLRYDPDSQRWECPCHGSTFTTLGEPLDGPAMTSAEVSARQR